MTESVSLTDRIVLANRYLCNPLDLLSSKKHILVIKGALILDENYLVAIKKVNFGASRKEIDSAIRKLILERNLLQKLAGCKTVVRFMDFIQNKNEIYLVTKFCDQGNMKEFLQTSKGFRNMKQIMYYFAQIAQTLYFLHTNSMVFAGLKPDSVLFHKKTIKLNEIYSCALSNEETFLKMKENPNFCAPEIVFEQKYGKEADVWSLGLLLYYMIYEKMPWGKEKNVKELRTYLAECDPNGKFVSFPEEWRFGVNALIQEFINKMVCIQPRNRISLLHILQDPLLSLFFEPKKETSQFYTKNKTDTFLDTSSDKMNAKMAFSVWKEEKEEVNVNKIREMKFNFLCRSTNSSKK